MSEPSVEVFRRFVPESAVSYCVRLYQKLGFEFQVKRTRRSKYGDYRYDPRTQKHTITINNDLNPYSFLITYIHEVAHLVTFKDHGRAVAPHGKEWKANFKKGLQPIMTSTIFPEPVLAALTSHLQSPKAASCSDPALYEMLRRYDPQLDGHISLRDVELGGHFVFNDETYEKLQIRRTRVLCQRIKDGKKYLISSVATVLKISP